ncbi:MAG: peptidoglycan-binding protein, partial [Brachybacterium sp.]|nr:peptidoglycan-binding protein [Brachybacterium sp.]
MIDYRGLTAPVGRGVGGAAVIGAVSATAVLSTGAAATAQAPSASAVGTVRGIAPSVAPSAAPAKKQSQFTSVKLRRGARGAAVSHLQERLNAHGASLTTDGVFGSATLRAVRNQQSQAGIGVDGVVGPVTWGTLTGATSTAPDTSTSHPKLRAGSRGAAV